MIGLWLFLGLALAFDPSATTRALNHADGRSGALRQLLKLNATDLQRARAAQLTPLIGLVAQDASARFADRVLATRALALLGAPDGVGSLRPLSVLTGSPENVALAREASRALRQLGAALALEGALAHPDPEVRAMAAAAGAGRQSLCRLLESDDWPMVRAAAARGLAAHPEEGAACLAAGLRDRRTQVVLAAIEAAGQVGAKALVGPLRRIAGDARASLPTRVEALIALGHLGDGEPARMVLRTHLAKGGIVPLAIAATRALAALNQIEDRPLLRRTLESEAPVVQITAAQVLATVGDTESVPLLEAMLPQLAPRHRETVRYQLRRLAPDRDWDPEDPASHDPE